MDTKSRRFGPFDVLTLQDGVFEASTDVFTHTAGAEARRASIAAWSDPVFRIDVNCFALHGPDGLMLVDAGTGTSWGEAFGHARTALAAAGMSPDAVRRVLITHLHGDHALGLFDGENPYFRNAEVWVPESDLSFFSDARTRAALPKARQGGFDIAERLQRLYGNRVRAIGEGAILPGIERVALPGHTRGHSGYLIRGADESLMLWGDVLHLSGLQAADPEIGLEYDLDGTTAAQIRRSVLTQAARNNWVVSGGHVRGFGRVRALGSGFEINPA